MRLLHCQIEATRAHPPTSCEIARPSPLLGGFAFQQNTLKVRSRRHRVIGAPVVRRICCLRLLICIAHLSKPLFEGTCMFCTLEPLKFCVVSTPRARAVLPHVESDHSSVCIWHVGPARMWPCYCSAAAVRLERCLEGHAVESDSSDSYTRRLQAGQSRPSGVRMNQLICR